MTETTIRFFFVNKTNKKKEEEEEDKFAGGHFGGLCAYFRWDNRETVREFIFIGRNGRRLCRVDDCASAELVINVLTGDNGPFQKSLAGRCAFVLRAFVSSFQRFVMIAFQRLWAAMLSARCPFNSSDLLSGSVYLDWCLVRQIRDATAF